MPDGELIIGSFSAGHEITKPALMAPEDRARVKAVMLADSTYSSWKDQAARIVSPPEGYVRYALDVIQNPDKLFVATSSNGRTAPYPSGSETIRALKDEIEKRSCLKFGEQSSLPGVSTLPPVDGGIWKLGNVWLADFAGAYQHAQHATVLAPQIWRGLLNPWLNGSLPASEPMVMACPAPMQERQASNGGLSPVGWVAVGVAALGAGYLGYRAFR